MQNARMRRLGGTWTRWLAAIVLLGAISAAVAVILAAHSPGPTIAAQKGPDPAATVRSFVEAWQAGDYDTMYSLLSRASHQHDHVQRVRARLQGRRRHRQPERAARGWPDACASCVCHLYRGRRHAPLRPPQPAHAAAAGARSARLPGGLDAVACLPRAVARRAAGAQVAPAAHPWRASWPPAARCWQKGRPTARSYPQGADFAEVTGYVKAPDPAQAAQRAKHGWPRTLPYGQGGLEESLDRVLAGAPRIDLDAFSAAGGPRRAGHPPGPQTARRDHHALQLSMQQAANAALGARYGGVVVLIRSHRCCAGGCRAGHGRHPAARLDVQDGDRIGGARGRQGDAGDELRLRPLRRPERLASCTTSTTRTVRRHAAATPSPSELQLGVRAAGRPGRGQAAGRRWPTPSASTASPPSPTRRRPASPAMPARDAQRSVAGRRRDRPGRGGGQRRCRWRRWRR